MESCHVDEVRLKANFALNPKNKVTLGQFMTPSVIADYMASLFVPVNKEVRLMDCGAGIGSLTISAVKALKRVAIIELWELDPIMCIYLEQNIRALEKPYVIHSEDYIHDSVNRIICKTGSQFTHAIINPPYRKIKSSSDYRKTLRSIGIETVNLYSAFLALTIKMMEKDGQIVAIIPRSFCNGPYYKSFREQMLLECSIDHIHVFESRNQAFKDDDVLQENIIIKLTKNAKQRDVTLSTSHNQLFNDYIEKTVSFKSIVKDSDKERFIHIPINELDIKNDLFKIELAALSVTVSTGPVVDFRMKEFLEKEPTKTTAPLLYSHHFVNGQLEYPKQHKKANAIRITPETEKWLMPNGFYVLVKRFTAKEEKKRVVAQIIDPQDINTLKIGFENHWNVFHFKKHGIDETLAKGLACFLNSTQLDNYFRVFSGHTQVNATDLKNIKYPTLEVLMDLGKHYNTQMSQNQIDELIIGAVY